MATKKVEPKVAEESKLTSDIAKQMLEQDRRDREQKCQEELSALVQKYNCMLVARCTIVNNQIVSDVLVVANG